MVTFDTSVHLTSCCINITRTSENNYVKQHFNSSLDFGMNSDFETTKRVTSQHNYGVFLG